MQLQSTTALALTFTFIIFFFLNEQETSSHSLTPPLSLMGSADEVNMTTYHGLPGGIPGHSRAFQEVKDFSRDWNFFTPTLLARWYVFASLL